MLGRYTLFLSTSNAILGQNLGYLGNLTSLCTLHFPYHRLVAILAIG